MSKPKGVSEARVEFVVDDDTPELTPERAARLRPAKDILPEEVLAQFRRSPGRPKSASPKKQITLRLDADVLEYWRGQGEGWQSKLNAALRRQSGLSN